MRLGSLQLRASQLTVLYRLLEKFDPSQNISSQLPIAVNAISEILENKNTVVEISKHLASIGNLYILGRGVHYPIAKESALKIKELSYVHAEDVATGELKMVL